MIFKYIVSTTTGEIQQGKMEASSKDEVLSSLRKKNLSVVSIEKQRKKMALAPYGVVQGLVLGQISTIDKVIFARHLSIMLRSGLSLIEALQIIQEQTPTKSMRKVIQGVVESVSNGQSLADSLEQYSTRFSGIIIGMVRVGEASGTLEENLEYAATELEKDYELKRKVRSAMIYPSIVLSATFLLGTGLSIFILPRLVDMFKTFRIELPTITKIFLNIATFLVDYGWYLLGLVAILLIATRVLVKAPATRPFFHKLYLILPVVKKITRNTNLARMTRILSVLLKSGVTINESLAITSQVVENVFFKRELLRAQEGLQKGKSLGSVLNDERYLPKMANRMIGVGEKTGKLEDTLAYLGDFYAADVDNATKNLASVIEPILLIVMGLVIGFLSIAIISPIYQFTGSLTR